MFNQLKIQKDIANLMQEAKELGFIEEDTNNENLTENDEPKCVVCGKAEAVDGLHCSEECAYESWVNNVEAEATGN